MIDKDTFVAIHHRVASLNSTLAQLGAISVKPTLAGAGAYIPLETLSRYAQKRGYIGSLIEQINGTYSYKMYDACAVMLRRLIETMIIELYEAHRIDNEIKDKNGNFVELDSLLNELDSQSHWNFGRTTKRSLKKLREAKALGDLSAHNRRWLCHLDHLDSIKLDVNVTVQEMVHLTELI